jgi:protein-tyrosine phosphatase
MRVYEIVPGLYQSPTPEEHPFTDGDGHQVDINALIDLEGDIDPVVPQRKIGDVYVYWPIEDGELKDPLTVQGLARFVSGLMDAGYRVLVHCRAGMNRASLVTGRVLIHRGMEPEDAISLLRERRDPEVLSNIAFRGWLLGERPGH